MKGTNPPLLNSIRMNSNLQVPTNIRTPGLVWKKTWKRQQPEESYRMLPKTSSLDLLHRSKRRRLPYPSALLAASVHIFQILAPFATLVLAIMATSIDNTYLGLNKRYIPTDPVMSTDTVISYDSNGHSIPLSNVTAGFNGVLLEAARFGPTVLPLLCSFVVPMTLRLLARWKSQTGARLIKSSSAVDL